MVRPRRDLGGLRLRGEAGVLRRAAAPSRPACCTTPHRPPAGARAPCRPRPRRCRTASTSCSPGTARRRRPPGEVVCQGEQEGWVQELVHHGEVVRPRGGSAPPAPPAVRESRWRRRRRRLRRAGAPPVPAGRPLPARAPGHEGEPAEAAAVAAPEEGSGRRLVGWGKRGRGLRIGFMR